MPSMAEREGEPAGRWQERSSSGGRILYCSRLGEFTGFERARRSWVIQEVLRRHASSRATAT